MRAGVGVRAGVEAPPNPPTTPAHTGQGTRPGVLFRAYPGPWQVLARDPDVAGPGGTRLVASLEARPTLREVSLDILPRG